MPGLQRSASLDMALDAAMCGVVGSFWVYAALLEYLQRFSPGRHSSIEDFAASALGALCGGLAVALLWRHRFDQPG
jgi:VanZ family protein